MISLLFFIITVIMEKCEISTGTATAKSLPVSSFTLLLHKQNNPRLTSKEFQQMVGNAYELLQSSSFSTKRKFFLGLIQRLKDLQLLKQVVRVLSSVKQKDFIYSRSQCNSSLLLEHKAFSSSQHELADKAIENHILKTWRWFSTICISDRANFLYCIANEIKDSSILYQALNLAKTIYIQQRKKLEIDDLSISSEDSSLTSSDYSFYTDEHPDLYMLSSINPQYKSLKTEHHKLNDDYGEDEFVETSSLDQDSTSSLSSLDPRLLMAAKSRKALSGVSPIIDFVSKLPIHLGKKIIGFLHVSSQSNAALVNRKWHETVRQVQTEMRTRQEICEEAVMMQGVSAKGAHPNYAKKKIVPVPVFSTDEHKHISMDQMFQHQPGMKKNDIPVIPGLTIAQFEMEERNVYCGSYNVLVLDKRRDKYRVMHYGGGDTIASGSCNRIIRLFNVHTGRETFPSIRGHPGSIKSLHVADVDRNYIFSGSYDTTIRRWHLGSSGCHQIMHGHSKSIIALDYSCGTLVSGSKDGLVKIWNVKNGNCTCTFRHAKSAFVTSVKIHNQTVVSSCDRGVIKVWDLDSRKLIKCLVGHTDVVSQVSVNNHYIVSASHDEYVFTWIKEGNIDQPVKSYRHPKAVLCVELRYLRIVSGCADGKVRVLHLHTGECLRVIRGNSKCEPILTLCATANRLIVNMESNLMLLQFEELELNYGVKYDQTTDEDADNQLADGKANCLYSVHSNSYVRACRHRASSITCSNIRNRPLSAPVKRQMPLTNTKRPLSSFPSLNLTKATTSQISFPAELQRPKSCYSLAEESEITGRRSSRNAFNVHNSKAMSVISCISSAIIDQDTILDDLFPAKPPPSQSRQSKSSLRSAKNERIHSRDRLHLRVGSIRHNMKNSLEDVNTALNGAHPDVREVYHSYMEKI